MLADSANAITFLLSIVTLPAAGHMIYVTFRTIRLNHLKSRELNAAWALLVLFHLIFLISSFNIVIQILNYYTVAGRHNVSVLRSLFTQIAALLALYVYKKI